MIDGLRIGLQVVSGHSGRRNLLVGAAAAVVATMACLTVLAAPQVRAGEGARAAAQEPVLAKGPTGSAYRYIPSPRYRGRQVDTVLLTGDPATKVLPPGVERLPRPGEMYVSPELDHRLRTDANLRRWFHYRNLGTVEPVGGQLLAYVGVSLEDFGPTAGTWVSSFGPSSPVHDLGAYENLGLVIFVLLPALGVLLAAGRAGSRVRGERATALRLLGVTKAATRLVGFVEQAVPAAVGAALGALSYRAVAASVEVLPIVGRRLSAPDLAPTAGSLAWAMAATIAVAGLLGALSSAASFGRQRAQAPTRGIRDGRWMWVGFVAGLGAVAAAWARPRPRDPVLWVGIVLLGLGLPAMTAALTSLGARLRDSNRTPTWAFLGIRRLGADRRPSMRYGATLGLAVFALGVSQPISQVVAQPTSTWLIAAREDHQRSVLARAISLNRSPVTLDAGRPEGVSPPITMVGLWDPAQTQPEPVTSALIATCRQLAALLATPLPTCRPEPMLLDFGDEQWPRTLPDALALRPGARPTIAVPTARLPITLRYLDIPVEATLVLPPDDPRLAHASRFMTGQYMRIPTQQRPWDQAQAWVGGSSPELRLENGYEGSEVHDSTGPWILLGLTTVAALASIGLGLALVGRPGTTDRTDDTNLRMIGLPRRDLFAAFVVAELTAGGTAVFLATIAGLATAATYLRVNDEQLRSLTPLALGSGLALLVAVVASVAAAALRDRRTVQ